MRRVSRRRIRWRSTLGVVRITALTLGVAILWFGASVPWGLPILDVLPFAAPGALIGLATGWMAHAATRWQWTWNAAKRSALFGAAVIAPILVFYVGIQGNLHPERLIVGFVRAAWLAFAIGAAWAGMLWVRRRRNARAARDVQPTGGRNRSRVA